MIYKCVSNLNELQSHSIFSGTYWELLKTTDNEVFLKEFSNIPTEDIVKIEKCLFDDTNFIKCEKVEVIK